MFLLNVSFQAWIFEEMDVEKGFLHQGPGVSSGVNHVGNHDGEVSTQQISSNHCNANLASKETTPSPTEVVSLNNIKMTDFPIDGDMNGSSEKEVK